MRTFMLMVPAVASVLGLAAHSLGDKSPAKPASESDAGFYQDPGPWWSWLYLTDIPGSFHPYNVTGPHKNQFFSLVGERGLNPVAAVFVRGDDLKPVLPLLKKLDVAVDRNDRYFLGSYVVLLHDDILDDQVRAATDTKPEDLVKDDDQRAALAKTLTEAAVD